MRMTPFFLFFALLNIVACDGEIETVDGVKTSDPLYASVKQKCGDDALVLRAESDEFEDEALCCLSYTAFVPSLHCMTSNGGEVTNPGSVSKLVEVIKEANLADKK